jgi:histidyl-tRNA synthetase
MKPTLPQGTRDFSPEIVRKRSFIFKTIQTQFELYGFEPLETPAFENIDTLMGKYGEEGDKLIFKILNNGLDRPEKHVQAQEDFNRVLTGKNVKGITERALKYDLTIPFARYVAMNKGQINFPFKRYQIQPVWRADRPQRGRYREFTQCDADVVGSKSLINEIELIQLYKEVFEKLNIPVVICVNNRKILAALAELAGGASRLTDITIAIDKLDKTSLDKVMEELSAKNLDEQALDTVKRYLSLKTDETNNEEIIQKLEAMIGMIDIGKEGLQEITFITNHFAHIKLDVTLARGLNYYTGTILEVKPLGIQMGSIGGGGRYDDLTGLFGVPDVPGVGISFGVDRIYDVMDELKLFPDAIQQSVEVMLVNFGEMFQQRNFDILHFLRKNQISAELYPDVIKFDKQLKYAHKKKVSFIIIIGEDELKEGTISIKNFTTGVQEKCQLNDLLQWIK